MRSKLIVSSLLNSLVARTIFFFEHHLDIISINADRYIIPVEANGYKHCLLDPMTIAGNTTPARHSAAQCRGAKCLIDPHSWLIRICSSARDFNDNNILSFHLTPGNIAYMQRARSASTDKTQSIELNQSRIVLDRASARRNQASRANDSSSRARRNTKPSAHAQLHNYRLGGGRASS